MKASEWLPSINHPKYIYELAAFQLTNDRCRLFALDYKRDIWGIQQDDSGNFTHWWHPSTGYWNRAPAPFKKIAGSHGSKPEGSTAVTSGGAIFIGLKEDGRFAVCFNTGGDSWSRFRNDWHGVGPIPNYPLFKKRQRAARQRTARFAFWRTLRFPALATKT